MLAVHFRAYVHLPLSDNIAERSEVQEGRLPRIQSRHVNPKIAESSVIKSDPKLSMAQSPQLTSIDHSTVTPMCRCNSSTADSAKVSPVPSGHVSVSHLLIMFHMTSCLAEMSSQREAQRETHRCMRGWLQLKAGTDNWGKEAPQ